MRTQAVSISVRTLLVAATLFLPASASAQAPYLAKGNQELNAFGGLSFGLDRWRGSYGANYAIAPFDKYVMVYGEYSYFPGIERKFNEVRDSSGGLIIRGGNSAVKFNDLHAGVHIRMPIFREKRIVPYLSGGVGVLRQSGDVSLQANQGGGVFQTVKGPVSGSTFAINGGAGLRLYLSGDGRFGMRFEAKTYRPNSDISVRIAGRDVTSQSAAFGKVTIGFFYQIK